MSTEGPAGVARRSLPAIGSFAALLVAIGLLLANTANEVERQTRAGWQGLSRRYWEDVYIAIGYRLTGAFGTSHLPWVGIGTPKGRAYVEARPTLTRATQEGGIQSWQVWRTVPLEDFRRRHRPPIADRYQPSSAFDRDTGRPLLLALGFALLGGVSPYLIFWLGAFVAMPVLTWIWLELCWAGRESAASALVLLVSSSAFVVGALALDYSATGFYVVALLALTALCAYAAAGTISDSGLVARGVMAGIVFGICVTSRAATVLLAPGFALALVVAAVRRPVAAGGRGRRLVAPVLAAAAFLGLTSLFVQVPEMMLERTIERRTDAPAPPPTRSFWHAVWIGLGDFDRKKGHVWNDFAAYEAALAAGGAMSTTTRYQAVNEPILRRLVLTEIVDDPGWFAGIAVRRFAATTLQTKLWPWKPMDGVSLTPAMSENEGVIDSYYALTPTADWFRFGARLIELPVTLIAAPTTLLIGVAMVKKRRKDPSPAAQHARKSLAGLGILAGASLIQPVGLTTASGLETQAFVLVYLAGAALALESALVAWRGFRAAPSGWATAPTDGA